MTSTPEPASPPIGTPSAPAAPGAAPAADHAAGGAQAHVVVLPPLEESIRAIEHVRQLLHEAVEHLDSGDDEQLAHAYEKSAESTDTVARALWFLHRVAREREGQGSPAGGATSGPAAH